MRTVTRLTVAFASAGIEHSGASKDGDCRLAGYKAAKCAEQSR